MTLHHRIAHLERRDDGPQDSLDLPLDWAGTLVRDWTTAAEDLHARAHEPDGAPRIEIVLVRVDSEAAILTLVGENVDALSRAWLATIDPWLDAHGLVVVESAHQGTELLRIDRGASTIAAPSGATVLDEFVQAVTATSTVWGLYGKTWARSDAAGDREALPLWPDPVAAARCIGGAWSGFAPRAIELDAFRGQWLTGMDEDGIVAVLCPSADDAGTIVAPAELMLALDATS